MASHISEITLLSLLIPFESFDFINRISVPIQKYPTVSKTNFSSNISLDSSWLVLDIKDSMIKEEWISSKLNFINKIELLKRCQMHYISNVKVINPVFRRFNPKLISEIQFKFLIIISIIQFLLQFQISLLICKVLMDLGWDFAQWLILIGSKLI